MSQIQSLELMLDDDLDDAVRGEWAALKAAGLPSLADHQGETNRPHVTLCVATSVPPYVETALRSALTGRLPVPIRLGGLLCFGAPGGRQIMVRAVVPHHHLLDLHERCADLFDGLPGGPDHTRPGSWTPHVTLARLSNAQVGTALTALAGTDGGPPDLVGQAVGARRWDASARRVWQIA